MSDEWTEVKGGVMFSFDSEGDSLEGELIDVRTEQGKYKSTFDDIKRGNDLLSVFGSTVLDGRMKRVKIGEFVKIVFKGVQANKEGNNYKDYQVFVKEPENEGDA